MKIVKYNIGKYQIRDRYFNNDFYNRTIKIKINCNNYVISENYNGLWSAYIDYGDNGVFPACVLPFWDYIKDYANKYQCIMALKKALKEQQDYYNLID